MNVFRVYRGEVALVADQNQTFIEEKWNHANDCRWNLDLELWEEEGGCDCEKEIMMVVTKGDAQYALEIGLEAIADAVEPDDIEIFCQKVRGIKGK